MAAFISFFLWCAGQEFTAAYTGQKASFWNWPKQLGEYMRENK